MKFNFSKLRTKRSLLSGLILLVLIIGIIIFCTLPRGLTMPPAEAINAAVARLSEGENYRFSCHSDLNIDGESLDYGLIQGERNAEGCHIWGKILGSSMEVYQIGDVNYRKDPLTEQWQKTEGQKMEDSAMLINELDPTSNFRFEELGAIEEQGSEKLDNGKCYKFTLHPTLSDEWVRNNFQDITYTIWLYTDSLALAAAQISAQTKSGMATANLQIKLNFYDWGSDVVITAPTLP